MSVPNSQSSQPATVPQLLVRGLQPTTAGITPALLNGAPPNTAGNPSFVDQVTFDERHADEMEITDHPIAQGAPVTDHAFKKPAMLTVNIGWSESDPGGMTSNDLRQIYNDLLQGQANRVLYNVLTGKRYYTNMLIKSISVETDFRTEHVLKIKLEMKQLILVTAGTPSVPATNQTFPQVTNGVQNLGPTAVLPVSPGTSIGFGIE